MALTYGSREIVRNPSLLRIEENDSFIIEDKKANKTLGVYIGTKLADDFFKYIKKQKLLNAANKIKQNSQEELKLLSGTI